MRKYLVSLIFVNLFHFLKEGVHQNFIFELTDIAMHNFFSMSCFSNKPEKFRDKFRAKTFLGENIGPDAKVLVPDAKLLVPGC
jgi:hypothetical protein